VPATHSVADKLPAVSGSSGRLLVQRPPTEEERHWPGQVFTDAELPYAEAMQHFIQASQEQAPAPANCAAAIPAPPAVEKQALQQAAAQLRSARREVRAQRQLEDAAWQANRTAHRAAQSVEHADTTEERRQQRHAQRAAQCQWQALRAQRRVTLEQRAQEDTAWREQRQQLRERLAQLPVVTAWIAVLVVLDNCTRQCWGLPLFVAGAHVTAEMIVAALRDLLPPELQFLISDRGTHFKATAFQNFVRSAAFAHVFIARHRPQSNGIAERFVRTLKEWLAAKAWQNELELELLLQQFLEEYNDRPHQGLAIPGLSPNALAERIVVM
jgi:transposase InsO family protein